MADGSSTEVARGDTKDLAPWELASLASDGWRVWWPSAVVNALATAGPGATLVSVTRVEWSDACLGLPHPGAACLQVITAGYAIIVEQGGQRAEYHASISGALGRTP